MLMSTILFYLFFFGSFFVCLFNTAFMGEIMNSLTLVSRIKWARDTLLDASVWIDGTNSTEMFYTYSMAFTYGCWWSQPDLQFEGKRHLRNLKEPPDITLCCFHFRNDFYVFWQCHRETNKQTNGLQLLRHFKYIYVNNSTKVISFLKYWISPQKIKHEYQVYLRHVRVCAISIAAQSISVH